MAQSTKGFTNCQIDFEYGSPCIEIKLKLQVYHHYLLFSKQSPL